MPFSRLRGLLACAVVLGCAPLLTAQEQRPNFIIFIADDMAWDDCGAYGHPTIKTANIDRLAQSGVRFDNAFLTCSSCSPSRSSIVTGRYPHNTGARQLHQPLPADQITFSKLLREAGYWTASAGKWHLGGPAKRQFDQVVEGGGKWVAALADRPRDKPFCLWLAFSDPHRPYQKNTIEDPHQPQDAVVPPYLPDVPDTRQDLAMYYDEITRMDRVIGDVLAELDRQEAAENTLVLFLSDNGRPFPRAKTTLYDSGIKTPFIVRFPAMVAPGSVSNSLVSSVDIAPTLLDLAGVERAESFQGKSFVPLLKDPAAGIRDYVFAEHNWHDFDDHGRAVRSPRFKYIRNYYTDVPGTPPADAVRSPTFRAMLRMKDEGKLTEAQKNPFVVPRPREELYDVQADPHELNNLAGDAAHAEVLSQLRGELDAWEQRTGDRVPQQRTPDGFHRVTGERL